MATWGTLVKQCEMTMAHPCLHEKPHWMCFLIHNGLNYHDTTDSKFISTQQDSILFAIHSERFQESAGTETHLCRPRVGFVLVSCLSELKREPLSNPVPVCVQQLISVYSMWWIIKQHLCHTQSIRIRAETQRSVTLWTCSERTLL